MEMHFPLFEENLSDLFMKSSGVPPHVLGSVPVESAVNTLKESLTTHLSNKTNESAPLMSKAWFRYSRYQSLSVIDGLSRSLEYLGRWESLPVVGGLSGSLTVFQSLHLNCYFWRQTYSLPIVGGLSGSLAVTKGISFCFHMTQMKRQGRWRSFMVVHGRWDRPRVYPSDPVIQCFWGSLLVFAKI